MPLDADALTRVDAIIFDCDGVLVDSEMQACRIAAEELQAFGIAITAQRIATDYAGLSWPSLRQRLDSEFDVAIPDALVASCERRFEESVDSELRAVAGIAALLQRVRRPLCVASSSGVRRIARSLSATGLAEYFGDAVFSAQMVARGKPAPDLFLYAASGMGVAPARCLVIEDSPYGVEAAHAAGITPVGFTGGSHCGAATRRRLAEAGAAEIAADAAALAGLLEPLLGP